MGTKSFFGADSGLPKPAKKCGTYFIEEGFRKAAYTGDVKRMQQLLKAYPNINVNAQGDHGETAVYQACKSGEHKAIDHLLNHCGVDINIPTQGGNSPVLMAAWNEDDKLVNMLIQHGANLDQHTKNSREYHGGIGLVDLANECENPKVREIVDSALLNNGSDRG